MSNEEMEEFVTKLGQIINIKNDFFLDIKTKALLKNLQFFKEIWTTYPDKGDLIISKIISNMYINKYNQFEIIWDDPKNHLNGIFIVLQGVVNVYRYNFLSKSKSNEIKLNISIKQPRKRKDNKDINIQLEHNKPEKLNLKGSMTEELKPVNIDFIAKTGDSIGNTFLKDINENIKYRGRFKIKRSEKNFKENNNNDKYYYKIESKTKSIVAFLTEEDFNSIFDKMITKERHERINFLHKINYLPKDQDFIERFQNFITKKCFRKHSKIFKQGDEFRTFYIIISGSIRLSISFNRQFFCSLDYDVLIGNHINDRFTSSRLFEITGNYREKESFMVVDLEEGEILGGVEFHKNIKNYIFEAQCITDAILYEVNLKLFHNILPYWSFQRFYTKIDEQLKYFKNRILSMNNFRKEKEKQDDYSCDQNKFIKTYKRGHPISAKKEEYIKKYTNPFKFEKLLKSKEFKLKNQKSAKIDDLKKYKNIKDIRKENTISRVPFITNLPKKVRMERSIKKYKTMLNFKINKSQIKEDVSELAQESKNNEIKNTIEQQKPLKTRNILKHCNSALNINVNNVRKFRNRRLQSCKIDYNIKDKIRKNLLENKNTNSNVYYSAKSNYHLSNPKNKKKKNAETSIELNVKNNNIINDSINLLYKNYNKNIKKRNNNIIKESHSNDSYKNISNNLKNSYLVNKDYLIYNKILIPLIRENKNSSQLQINHKSLVFPSGIKEMNNLKVVNINEILPSFISNSFIRNEIKFKKISNINAFFLQQNNKLKNKSIGVN